MERKKNSNNTNFYVNNKFSHPFFHFSCCLLLMLLILSTVNIKKIDSYAKYKHPKNIKILLESGMAICDLLTILFPAPGLIYMYTLRNYDKPLGPASVCYIYYFFNETVPSLFHTASIWLTVGLAFQR